MHLYEKFKTIANQYPLQIAITQDSQIITYSDLNDWVLRFARILTEQGCQPGTIVGLYMESSIEYVVAMLAANALSATFFPLDTVQPRARLSQVVAMVGPSIIVAPTALQDSAREFIAYCGLQQCQLLDIDNNDQKEEVKFLVSDYDVIDTCYFIFTSGSTGTPKVIKGSCQGVVHFIDWEITTFALDRHCKIPQLAPIGFDVSFRDILAPLFCGGTVCIPVAGLKHNPIALIDWMGAAGINTLHIVPSLFRVLLHQLQQNDTPHVLLQKLQLILFAGEPLYYRDVFNWRQLAGVTAQLVNLYGPSETTLAKLFYLIDDQSASANEIVPLGLPLPDTNIFLLNEVQMPCNSGETGELYIYTKYPFYGYYREKGLDVNKFIRYPANSEHSVLLYRTGDLVKIQQGLVVFQGRTDDQIKVNGNRVELFEVESTLNKLTGIDRVVVICRAVPSAEQELCCFYSSRSTISVGDIKQYLNTCLPSYMHPVHFVQVATFPLNTNSKIDKLQLPSLLPSPSMATSWQTPTEAEIATIWSEVLKTPHISKNQSFYHIGGSSLKAIQIISRIKKHFDILITPMDFAQHSTICDLAAAIDQRIQAHNGMKLSNK